MFTDVGLSDKERTGPFQCLPGQAGFDVFGAEDLTARMRPELCMRQSELPGVLRTGCITIGSARTPQATNSMFAKKKFYCILVTLCGILIIDKVKQF